VNRLSGVPGWIAAHELPILFLAGPLFIFARPAFAPALLLLPVLWWARRCSRGHWIARTPVDWPILGLLTMVLVNSWLAPDLSYSLGKIAGVLYGIAIFYALVSWSRDRRQILPLALLVIGLGTAAALLSLLGTQWVTKLTVLQQIIGHLPMALRGVPGAESGFNPNQVTGVLIMFVPLQGLLIWGAISAPGLSRRQRTGLVTGVGLSLLLTGIVIVLAQSRAAWAALALGLLGVCAVAIRRLRLLFLLLLVASLALLAILGPTGPGEWLAQHGWMTSSGEATWDARLELWSRGLWILADHPLTGAGLNLFRRVVAEPYPLAHFPLATDVGHSHQTYLQVALDLGLPGLVCYLALIGGAVASGWRAILRTRPSWAALATLGSIAGLAVHAGWGLTDAIALGAKQGFLWWAMLALVVAPAVQAGARSQGNAMRGRPEVRAE